MYMVEWCRILAVELVQQEPAWYVEEQIGSCHNRNRKLNVVQAEPVVALYIGMPCAPTANKGEIQGGSSPQNRQRGSGPTANVLGGGAVLREAAVERAPHAYTEQNFCNR